MSRQRIENIVDRAREVRRLEVPRPEMRAALLDITIDHARSLADKTALLVEQSNAGPKDWQKLVRKMRAEWRAVCKAVKLVFADHPIADRHLYATLACYHPRLLGWSTFNQELTGEEQFALGRYMTSAERIALLRQILYQF